jgi:hypothetical protein
MLAHAAAEIGISSVMAWASALAVSNRSPGVAQAARARCMR